MSITCKESRLDQTKLPAEFGLLRLDYKYTIAYQNKNIARIEKNSSLSRAGLQLDSLDLSVNNIEAIEQGAFDQVIIKSFNLYNNSLRSLDFIVSICDLEQLIVDYNKIEYLDIKWFKCKANLTKLNMKSNNIKVIESRTFSSLAKLSTLDLDSNQLEIIESETFTNLTKLTVLKICFSGLREIKPYAFNNLSSLVSIPCLDYCLIETVHPFSFVGLSKLGALNFEGNQLTRLFKDSFVKLTSITELNFNNNLLGQIEPGVFNKMSKLEKLYLYRNYLTKVDNELLSSLKMLTILRIDQNKIETIDLDSFKDQTKSLQKLNMSCNKLGQVKKGHFSRLETLTDLDLSNNQISSIEPGSFENNINLVTLKLSQNCIFTIDRYLFKNVKSLTYLDMSYNVIFKLDILVFVNLSLLTDLSLSYNQIESLPDYMFKSLTSLKLLDLSNNRLRQLSSPRIYQGLDYLQTLFLSNNLIDTISFDSMSYFKKTVEILYLDSNRLDALDSGNDTFIALRILDFSSNRQLNNASRLMSILEKCQRCKYQLRLRNMSTSFIKGFVQHLNKLSLVKQIDSLDLSFNDLGSFFQSIPFEAMNSTLSELYLKSTNISDSFLPVLSKLYAVRYLDMSDNQLTLSKDYFQSLDIRKLFLSNTGITEFASQLGFNSLRYSTEIDLSHNSIEILRQQDFGFFLNLEKLNLSYNRILFIEDSTFYVRGSNFKVLDLSNNLLTSFTISLFKRINNIDILILIDLHLYNNKLTSYSFEKVRDHLNLQQNYLQEFSSQAPFLNLDRNNITVIKSVDAASKELSLSNNQILEIRDGLFIKCKYLYNIDLSLNAISILSANTFTGLLSLQYLNLSSNYIEFIDQKVFWQTNKLVQLDLNNNKIKAIMDKSFFYSSFLQKLYVDSLQMENVTNSTFEGLESIVFLTMSHVQFESVQNIKTMTKSFLKKSKSSNQRFTWYSSTNIEFEQSLMDTRYCSIVLYLARNNILINLVTNDDAVQFHTLCSIFSFHDLDYSIYGLI